MLLWVLKSLYNAQWYVLYVVLFGCLKFSKTKSMAESGLQYIT